MKPQGIWANLAEPGHVRPKRRRDSILASVMADTTVAWPVSGDEIARARADAAKSGNPFISITKIGDDSLYANTKDALEVSPDSRYLP